MDPQKVLLHPLKAFSEKKLSEKELFDHLNKFLPVIWRHGISEDTISDCLKIFISNNKLSYATRKVILQCFVPEKKLSKRTVKVLLMWCFSNLRQNDGILVLDWLAVMIPNNLVVIEPLENLFNQILFCIGDDKLAAPACDVIKGIVKPGLINSRSVFIIQQYLKRNYKMKDTKKIMYLQRLFYDVSPSFFDNPPRNAFDYALPKDKFSSSVAQYAFQNRFINTVPIQFLPVPKKTQKEKLSGVTLNCEVLLDNFSEIYGMNELGLRIKNKDINVDEVFSALGSKVGLLYLCWQNSMGWGLPKLIRPTTPQVLKKLLEVCRRVKSGLSFLPPAMPGVLMNWDGEENHEVIYELISWMHIESFTDLYKNVLFYLVNIYLTGTVTDKVRIIYSLTKLIQNKVTVTPPEVTVILIRLVSRLIKIGLCGTCLNSNLLLMASVRFYKYLSFIEEEYMVGTWTVAPPFVVFGAVFSDCFVLISEICSLVVRYNVDMYTKFKMLGVIDKFEEEQEIVKAYMRDLYLFLWEGQARKTELVSSEVNESFIRNIRTELDSVFTVRNHHGIIQLVKFIAKQLKRHHNMLTNEDFEEVLKSYCVGVIQLKNAVLTYDELDPMEEED